MRRALLVGSELGGLTGVHRDVALMDEVLGGLGFATVRATGGEATADGILTHLRDLVRDTADGDAAVVYYAGHGGRLRNPAPGPGLPRWLQYVVPTDVDDRTDGRARCVLAEELSLLQAQLTARTANVTTLLDCCHSARMARDADLVPRALDVAGLPVADLVARWRALRAQPWPGAAGVDGNPDAVRVVACSADEVAYERRSRAHDRRRHGVFTAALATVLTGADAATLTWRDVLAAVRPAVADRAPQRPEVEGPVDRLVFTTERRDGVGVRPVRVEGDAVLLDAAALFGIAPGDTFALVPPGGDPSAPLARATVARIADGRAVLRLDPVGAALPAGAAAWPQHVALGARPVVVLPADAPGRAELVTALTRTAQVRVVDDTDGALATVVLSGGGVQVRDAAGAPLYRTMAARPADAVADAVRRLARAAHVRDLGSGEGPAALPADVGISWLRVRPDGGDQPVAPGEHLFVGDRLVGRFTSTATERRYVSPVDVGLAGAVTVLGGAEPDGTALDPGDVYELGRDRFSDAGLPLHWPPGLPDDGPRAESLVTIVADARVDGLRALEQNGAVRDTSATSLGRLLADLATGRRDLTHPPVDPVRYRVDRLDVVLHPTPRPPEVREPEFAVDERPDPSFRLVAQDVAAERVTAALTGLTVHPDGALHGAPVRVDALAVTAAAGAPWQAATVRIGADATPPVGPLLVHDGPAARFLDLAVWVTPDDAGAPDLAELLADRDGTDPELATARAVLAALGVGALSGVGPGEAVVAAAEAAVATVVRAADRALQQAAGSGTAVLRTSLPPRRWSERASVATADVSFAWEVTDRDTDPAEEETGSGWELAAEFDRRAREPAPPDPGLLDALAEALDDEVLTALFEEVAAVCADDDRAVADRYAAHLLALAPRLPGDASRAVHAVVDVHTADLYARTGDTAEARLRADRCADDLADLLPALLGEHEWVLACLADAEGRDDDARGHALRARDLFAEHERWEPAAYAAEAAAAAHPAMAAAALADWDRTAQLWVTAGRPDDARRCVEHACGRLAEAMGNDATGADPALPVLCRTARDLALTHGLGVLAARLGLAEAAYATDAGASWAEVEALHERSRRELAALGLDPAEQRAEVARVDLALGRAALAHGRGPDAERLLAAALPALRAAEQEGEAQMCEGMLRPLRAALHPGSVDGPLATDEFTDPDVRAGLLLTDGLRMAAQGKLDEAQTLLAQAAAVPGVSADPDRTLVTEAVSAAVRAAAGDPGEVPGVLARVEARLDAGSRSPTARAALTQVAALLRTLPAADGPAPVADVGAALAALRALPPDHPERGDRAAALVAALLRGDPMADPRALRPLDELLEIADGAVPETPQWHRTRTAARLVSLMRALAEREVLAPEAAVARLDTLAAEAGDDPVLTPLVAAARRSVQLAQAMHYGDAGTLQRLSAETASFVDGFVATLPQDDPRLASLRETVVGMTDLLATNDRGDDVGPGLERMRQVVDRLAPGDLRTGAGEAMAALSGLLAMHTDPATPPASDAELQRLADQAERPGLSQADRSLAHAHVGTAALRAGRETDVDRITLGITHMQRAVATTPADAPQRTFHLTGLAVGLMRRAELTNATADLREAGDVLTEARAAAGGPGHPMWQMVNEMLAEVARQVGTDPDGHRAAVDGLQRHVWAVLTSDDLAGATAAARRAAADAADAARRCIASDDPAGAITALDAGRGLALFAATAVGSVADQLAAAGATALEQRWRAAAATGDPAQLSPELRRAVLTTLAGHGAAGALLDPPPYDEIQRALRTLDAEALVYLVPGAGPLPGYAVCAPAEGAPRFLVLPGLATDGVPDLDRFRTALQRRDTAARGDATPPGEPADRDLVGPAPTAAELVAAVEGVCAWAWGAAMGPLVERLVPELPAPPAGRPPRLVLVPMGDLARVPWQAARRPADRRYAIELVALSQAASARLLCATAARSRVPVSSGGLVVGDPDAGPRVPQLAAARREALAVREVHYRSARYLGRWPNGSESRSGPGTAGQVRGWLTAGGPGAGSVLHLACHGFVDTAADPPTAYLLLAGGEPLPAADLVALMAKDSHRAVGLVVLAACRTGLAMTGYDEAYSLGTAFLAGGARTVLSTQWAIPDEATSVLMFMVHHYLRAHRMPAWAALRAAQLWMLDPQRAVPDTMPRQLRERLRPDSLAAVVGWAAFVHWGQ